MTRVKRGKKSNGGVKANGAAAVSPSLSSLSNGQGQKREREDPYEQLEKKRSAFVELTPAARARAAAAPPPKENCVPVGERRSDKRNASRRCDGRGADRVPVHPSNGSEQATPESKKNKKNKKKEKQRRQKQREANKENRQENGEEDSNESEGEREGEYSFAQRMQQLANSENRSKKARRGSSSDEGEENSRDVVPYNGQQANGPRVRKRKLASGRVVETVEEDEETVPYVVEEPDDDGEAALNEHREEMARRVKTRRQGRTSDFAGVDFAAFYAEMSQADPYDEDEDGDFVIDDEFDGDEDDEDMDEEEGEESDGDEELEDEEFTDEEDEELEEETGEEGESDEVDEEAVTVRPEDIERIVQFSDSDEGEEGEEEGMSVSGEEMEEESGEDEEESGEEGEEDDDSSESSHVSDDSYESAYVDGNMEARAKEVSRASFSPSSPSSPIDFSTLPFYEDDSAISAARALDFMLGPCDNQTFFDDFFQTNALVVRRNDKHHYGNLFSTEQMMSILREEHLEYGVNINVALYENGVRTTHNGTGRAYPLAIADRIREGCSVQLTNPQAFSQSIWYLCEVLQEVFHCFVGANTYLTPAGSAGFAPHWDEIDAFLLQVEGRKYWKIYAPQRPEDELPLESSGNFTDAEMANRPVAFEGWLEQGDLLYIPRGFIHQARTDKKVHSLHVTVSCGRQWSFANLLQKVVPPAVEGFTGDRAKLRMQLPPGLLDMTGVAEMAGGYPLEEIGEAKLDAVLDRHLSHLRRYIMSLKESAVDSMAREFMRTALPPVLSPAEKQHSAWGNANADPFQEKGASRITKKSQVRLLRRHGQRLLFESEDEAFCVHRMANSRTYEGRPEQSFPVEAHEIDAFADLQSAYPDWVNVNNIEMTNKAKAAFLRKLFENGIIAVRTL